MINVTKSYLPSLKEFIKLTKEIWINGQLTNNGPMVKKLSIDLKNYLECNNIELVSNGTAALQLAIKALKLKDEIITTPYSYVATTNSIIWEGCVPKFVDINEDTFCINTELIEKAINDKTSAILATHVYGHPCDLENIHKIAKKFNLKVIYDAAHAFGVRVNGRSILDHGDCSTLSFHATKVFHTIEGGAVVSNLPKTDNKISLLKSHGHIGEEGYYDVGINAKMSEIHAAMGLCILPYIDKIIARRKKIYSWYKEFFDNSCVKLFSFNRENTSFNYAYSPIIMNDYESMMSVRQALISEKVFPRRYFYPSLNTLSFIPDKYKISCPVSESISWRVLALPLHHELTRSNVEKISKIVLDSL